MLLRLRSRTVLGLAALALIAGISARPAAAQTTIVADDITPTAGSAGQAVTGIQFSIANLNATTISVSPTILFYNNDGVGGGPGTVLGGLTFNPINQGSGVGVYTYNPGTSIFTLPTSTFYAGIYFNSGTATAAQLDDIGQGIFAPPTVGSSQNLFFQSSGQATNASNPSGGFFDFGGNPVADFGWSFNVGSTTVYSDVTNYTGFAYPNGGSPSAVTTTPEPSPVAPFALGALALGGLTLTARRKKAAVAA